jgi:hypothetical protein
MLEAGRGKYRTLNILYRSEYRWKLTRQKLLGIKYFVTFTSGWNEKNRNGYKGNIGATVGQS